MSQEDILKKAPHLNKTSHMLLSIIIITVEALVNDHLGNSKKWS